MNWLNTALLTLRQRFTPFRAWQGELTRPEVLRADVIAGVTVAMVLVPQSMAYAQLAGLPAYYGLYASFAPVMVAAVFGSSRQLATGPVAVVSLMTASALGPLAAGDPDAYVAYAVMLALMVGLFQLALGLFRLGVLVDFLSHPVVVGFTNAAAIIIATSQLDKVLGVSVAKAERHYLTVWNTMASGWHDAHGPTVAMAALALGLMLAVRHLLPRLRHLAVLVAVALTTLLSWALDYAARHGGRVVGEIPAGLPPVKMPALDLEVAAELVTVAITVSLIGFMEAISIAKAMAAQTRQRLDPNQELVGQGLANITSSLFQGYAVSGSFSRSAVNIGAGAVTGFSSVVTGVAVGFALVFLTPLLYHLPHATLAAVIIMAVIQLVKVAPMVHAWRADRNDGVVAVITFVLTLVLAPHLENGIIIGVLLALGLFLFRTMHPRMVELARHQDGTLRDAAVNILPTDPRVSLIRFDGPLYFASSGYFETRVLANVAAKPECRYVIVDAAGINELDATGEQMLRSLIERLSATGVEVLFARANKQFLDVLYRTGFVAKVGEERFFRLRRQALDHVFEVLGIEKDSSPLFTAEPRSADGAAAKAD